jgi:HAD superfamily hydrolase (TIGR01509 family)
LEAIVLQPIPTPAAPNPAWPTKRYAGIIFDCDGTLTDSMPVHYLAWRETMNRYDIDFPEDRFYELGGMPTNKIIRLLADEQGREVPVDRASEEKEAAFVDRLEMLEPIPAVRDVAKSFLGSVPMAVASGGYREIVRRQLRKIGCEDWFDTVVGAEDTERHKPEPDAFLESARRLGVAADQCLVYEDSELGILAAKAASMDVIDVRTFHRPKRWS